MCRPHTQFSNQFLIAIEHRAMIHSKNKKQNKKQNKKKKTTTTTNPPPKKKKKHKKQHIYGCSPCHFSKDKSPSEEEWQCSLALGSYGLTSK